METFLKHKAIPFEKIGKSRTFFIFDEEAEKFNVLAYYTLALQVLKVPFSFSNREVKKLDGFSAKIRGERIAAVPAILIGQVGKNELYRETLTGFELMQYCLSTLLAGRCTWVEGL